MTALCVVGGGPTAVSVLERLLANAPELAGDERLRVHLVDPHPPGGGRVWRAGQTALLWANSLVADVTITPDPSVVVEGPVEEGTTLAEWIERVGRALPDGDPVGEEARRLTPTSFPSRPLVNAYLSWVLDGVVAALAPFADVEVHATRVTDLRRTREGVDVVLADGGVLPVDTVVLAQGHLEAGPTAEERAHTAAAERAGVRYLPTGYTADLDLGALAPGEDVLVRGAGLAFVDLAVLVTAGRGGRFVRDDGGRLRYEPSGAEPVLHVGSRRGVPYRSKLGYTWAGPPVPLRFLTPAAVDAAFGPTRRLDLQADLGPLLARELAWAHYTELFRAAPERTALPWADFAGRFLAAAGPEEERALAAEAVPDPADRFDLAALDRPLAGRSFADAGSLQEAVRAHVRADLARATDLRHSSDAAVFVALLQSFGAVAALLAAGRLTARSQADQLPGWFMNLFSYLASGPPGPRLEELLALSEAGVLRWLGADVEVTLDADAGVFRARSASCPGETVARTLVEARLPRPDVEASRAPLVTALLGRGAARERVLADDTAPAGVRRTGRLDVDPDNRLVDRRGVPDPHVFALGAWTAGPQVAGFSRPRTNAPLFRTTDALARAVWRSLTPALAAEVA
ncbi:FAD/NAD(P)-binding protein [Geodermatophilus aquaeductus]|uniref:FAD-NAD(P)-binding n=1 Tax=Geodermatophilus aquaeductus TaxID=1564161 RepID=A0A521DPT8_9ACTN|nr:FAD/NAD(P)-binding protein [Geodermatophilus aquaeductus]SMO73703.1 FAD-NAD(P)-binding [Geodermatophilus aquaeductus]